MMTELRQKKAKPKPRRILSVPLSPEQMTDLARRAGRGSMSAYTRALLFPANDNNAPVPRSRGVSPVRDHVALAQVLAKIGQWEAARSLRELAELAKSGALPITAETEAQISEARCDIAEIKTLLMAALGVRER